MNSPIVDWWKVIWFPLAIPKHPFILWLAIKNRPRKGDRLIKRGYKGVVVCLFCWSEMESREHMFFKCGFSARIWKECMARCTVALPWTEWEDVLHCAVQEWRNKSLEANICRLVLCASLYNIGVLIMNGSMELAQNRRANYAKCFWEIRTRIWGKGSFKRCYENFELCRNWSINEELLV